MNSFQVQTLTPIVEERDIELGDSNSRDANTDFGQLQPDQLIAFEQHHNVQQPSNASYILDSRSLSIMMDSYPNRKMSPSDIGSSVAVDAGNARTMSVSTSSDTTTQSMNGGKRETRSDGKAPRQQHHRAHGQQKKHLRKLPNATKQQELDPVKDQSVDIHSNRMNKRIGIIVVITILFVSLAAACISFRAHNNNNSNSLDYPGPASSDSSDYITNKLRDIITDTETLTSLFTEGTPQYNARMWLSHDDLQLRSTSSNAEYRVYQRFVLATLYMATDGESWKRNDSINNNSSSSSKSPKAITSASKRNFGNDASFSFLNPYTHECAWTGVACNPIDGTTDVITQVNLSRRNLNGKLPREIALLSNLQHLRLGENTLTGVIPETIQELPNLKYIDISQNQMSGTIPSGLWSLSLLRFVYLYDNTFSGRIYDDNQQNRHTQVLRDVWLHQNELTGSIPSWFGELQQLESLILFDNLLTGDIQGSMFPSSRNNELSRLSYLDLSSNMLWGSIPSDNGLRSLSHLDLSSNLIQGTIPSNLFNTQQLYYPSLQHAYLNNNMISGRLPSGNSHSNIKNLWLNSNNLSGTIPEQFGSHWYRLKELLLHDNKFTGNITECAAITSKKPTPETSTSSSMSRSIPHFWPEIERLEADCSLQSVQCSCCTKCYTPSE